MYIQIIKFDSWVPYEPAWRFSSAMQNFHVHWLWKQLISKEMNNNNNLKFA